MNNILLSVIVPVYNVAEYLPNCLDSLLHQGIKDKEYEIILINDGSTDNSQAICNNYVITNSNIVLINQENRGVAAARNRGLEQAKGKFVVFVDGDDYLADNGLFQISILLKKYPDVNLVRFYSSYSSHVKELQENNEVEYFGKAEQLLRGGGYPAFIWTHAYQKEFLDKNHIRFHNLRFSEDGLFISTVYLNNPTIVSTTANIYRYVLRADSAIGKRSRMHSKICADDCITAYELTNNEFEESIFKNSMEVRRACEHSQNIKKNSCFSRYLSASLSYADFKKCKKRIVDNKFYPIVAWNESNKLRMMCRCVNFMFSCYPVYRFSAFIFNKIFIPYFLPLYRKRVWANN